MRIGEKLRSWVPEWAVATPIVRPISSIGLTSFASSRCYPYRPSHSPADRETLIVRGKIVSEVLNVLDWDFDDHYFMDAD